HVDVAHAGDLLFSENFDGYVQLADSPLFGVVDLNAKSGWTGAANTELGANGYAGIPTTSGDDTSAYWLDTQNSPGGIDISHGFVDPTGDKAQLSFDIAVQSLNYQGQHYETDPNAAIEFKIDGATVASFTHDQLLAQAGGVDKMHHVDVLFATGAAGS